MCFGDLVAGGPGDVAVEDGDVVGVDAQQLQSGVAVTGDVGRDRLQTQPVADGLCQKGFVLDDQYTHAADPTIRTISSAYRKPHTCRQRHAALTVRHESNRPGTDGEPSDSPDVRDHEPSDPQEPRGRPAGRHSRRSPKSLGYRLLRLRDRGGLGVADGAIPFRTKVVDDAVPGVANLDPALLAALRGPRRVAAAFRGRALCQQRLALPGVPAAASPRGRRRVRIRGGGRPVGVHCGAICSRGGGRGRHRARRRRGRGCPSTAPRSGCAGSTATSPGTSSCAPKRSTTAARPCTPTLHRTRGRKGDSRFGMTGAYAEHAVATGVQTDHRSAW